MQELVNKMESRTNGDIVEENIQDTIAVLKDRSKTVLGVAPTETFLPFD